VTLAYADELSVGQKVQFTSPDVAGNWTGTIDRISPVVDGASQSINVITNVRGKDLREGMYLTGAIEGVQVFNALSLPAYMVFDNEYVYTVESDSILQKTKIQVVEWLDDQIIITGIASGTRMVDAPTLKAAAGTIVNTIDNR
jgi:multidrug efflux pump subunit AcrA (membrane-fusion protein)